MSKRDALQALDTNSLAQQRPRGTPGGRDRKDIGRATKSAADAFTLKKTPKISNCAAVAADASSHSKPPIPPQRRAGRKKKSFVTTRGRRTNNKTAPPSPAFALTNSELEELILTPSQREKQKIDSRSSKLNKETSKEVKNASGAHVGVANPPWASPDNRNVAERSLTPKVSQTTSSVSLETVRGNLNDINGHKETEYGDGRPGKAKVSSDEDMDCDSDTPSDLNDDDSDQSSDGCDAMMKDSSPNGPTESGNQKPPSSEPAADYLPPTNRSEAWKSRAISSPKRTEGAGLRQTPNLISTALTKEQINTLKNQPADNENVFRLVMSSDTISRKDHMPSLVGAFVGGDQLERPESLDGSEITSNTVNKLKRKLKKMTHINQVLQSRMREDQAKSPCGEAPPTAKAEPKYDNRKCRVVGDFPLVVGATVEEWSIDEEDSMSTASVLFRQGDKRFIHPQVPPGWKVDISNSGERVRYFRPNQRETPTCPVELPSKSEAKTLRIAKIGKRRRRSADVYFEAKSPFDGGQPGKPEAESDAAEDTVDLESSMSALNRTYHATSRHVRVQDSDSQTASVASSISHLLRENDFGQQDVVFQKKPGTKSSKTVQGVKYTPWMATGTTSRAAEKWDETRCDLDAEPSHTPNEASDVDSVKRAETDPRNEPGHSIAVPVCYKASLSTELPANMAAKLSPIKELVGMSARYRDESIGRDASPENSSMAGSIEGQSSTCLAGIKLPTRTPPKALDMGTNQPENSSDTQERVVRSATRRLHALRLATPVSSGAAIPTPVRDHSTLKTPHVNRESMPASIASTPISRSLLFGKSLSKNALRDSAPFLKMYKLGPPKLNRDLVSNGSKEQPSISPENVRNDFYEDQTPVSPMRPRGDQQIARIQNTRHRVDESGRRDMEASASHALATEAKLESDGDQAMLSPRANLNLRQVTCEMQIDYETVGVSTQSRLAKSSTGRVLMVSPKLIEAQQPSRLGRDQLSSRGKVKRISNQKDTGFGNGCQRYFDDTESAFPDEISPMAYRETPNSVPAFIETSNSSSHSCHDVQAHTTTCIGREHELGMSDATCNRDYEAKIGGEQKESPDERTPVARQGTPTEGSVENGPVASLLRESTHSKARLLVDEQSFGAKSGIGTESIGFSEVHRNDPTDMASHYRFEKTHRQTLLSKKKDTRFGNGNSSCFDDAESAFPDEISPMAYRETPNSVPAFIETSSGCSHSCHDVQAHATTTSGRGQDHEDVASPRISPQIHGQEPPSKQEGSGFGGGNQRCCYDTESEYPDEISPVAYRETPNSVPDVIETSSGSSRSCRDVQAHATVPSDRGKQPGMSDASCHSEYVARTGNENQESSGARTPVARNSTPAEGSGERHGLASLLQESTRSQTRSPLDGPCLRAKSGIGTESICCDELHTNRPEDVVSPHIFPKPPRKEGADNCARRCGLAKDVSLEELDPKMSLPIEGDWQSPGCSGIRSCSASDEASPQADRNSVGSGAPDSPEGHRVTLRQASKARFSANPKPLKRSAIVPLYYGKAKRIEPARPQEDLESTEDAVDSDNFGFVDQEDSDGEESSSPVDRTPLEKGKRDARKGREGIRDDRSTSSPEDSHANSLSVSTHMNRQVEIDTEDVSICSTTTTGGDQDVVYNARGRRMGWRVFNPPHPICSLQRLDSLPRHRGKKRRVGRRRTVNVSRKQKMNRRKNVRRRSKD